MNWKKIGYVIVGYFVIGLLVYLFRTLQQGHFIDDPTYVLLWPSWFLETTLGSVLYFALGEGGGLCLKIWCILLLVLALILMVVYVHLLYLLYRWVRK